MEEQERMPRVLISKISPEWISNSLKQQETYLRSFQKIFRVNVTCIAQIKSSQKSVNYM